MFSKRFRHECVALFLTLIAISNLCASGNQAGETIGAVSADFFLFFCQEQEDFKIALDIISGYAKAKKTFETIQDDLKDKCDFM